MTDKLTEKPTEQPIVANEDHIANEGFGLNHFEQDSETDSHAVETSENIDAFYDDDLFGDAEQQNRTEQTELSDSDGKTAPFAASWDDDQLKKTEYEKKEPRIPQISESVTTGDTSESRNKHTP